MYYCYNWDGIAEFQPNGIAEFLHAIVEFQHDDMMIWKLIDSAAYHGLTVKPGCTDNCKK